MHSKIMLWGINVWGLTLLTQFSKPIAQYIKIP